MKIKIGPLHSVMLDPGGLAGQRVANSYSALAMEHEVCCFDEPTQHVDP